MTIAEGRNVNCPINGELCLLNNHLIHQNSPIPEPNRTFDHEICKLLAMTSAISKGHNTSVWVENHDFIFGVTDPRLCTFTLIFWTLNEDKSNVGAAQGLHLQILSMKVMNRTSDKGEDQLYSIVRNVKYQTMLIFLFVVVMQVHFQIQCEHYYKDFLLYLFCMFNLQTHAKHLSKPRLALYLPWPFIASCKSR